MLTQVPSLEEIRSLEEALHRPEVRRSKAEIEILLADEFVEFGASGNAYNRSRMIELLVQESDDDPGVLRANDYMLTSISDDAVLLTYKTERLFENGFKRTVLRSSIWKHDGARWQMLFHQGTPIA